MSEMVLNRDEFRFTQSTAKGTVEGKMSVSPTGKGHVCVRGLAWFKGKMYTFRFDVAGADWSDWPSSHKPEGTVEQSWESAGKFGVPIAPTFFEPFKAAVLKVAAESGKWSPEIEYRVTLEKLVHEMQQALAEVEVIEDGLEVAKNKHDAAYRAVEDYMTAHAKEEDA